jgi:hypothetical protein
MPVATSHIMSAKDGVRSLVDSMVAGSGPDARSPPCSGLLFSCSGLLFRLNQNPQMSISAKPKKARGRPATGRDPMIGLRASDQLRTAIDAWAARQPDKPSRSEAIRRLVELGLKKTK